MRALASLLAPLALALPLAANQLHVPGDFGDIQSAIDAVWSGLFAQRDGESRAEWPYYQRLYIAQAFWQLSDTSHFERWYADERERMLRAQQSDGSWKDRNWGSCYATAVNCLVLAIPEGVLPVFQR